MVLVREWANAPMVINPQKLKFGHFSLICLTKAMTSPGSIPPLFSSPDVLTCKENTENIKVYKGLFVDLLES